MQGLGIDLLHSLHLDEAHRRPGDSFGDCLSVERVVLVRLQINIAQKIGVTLPAVYNWIRGGKPRQPQRAKLTGLLGIDIVEAAGQVERETRAAAFQAGHAEREKRVAAMAAVYEARRAEANDVEIVDAPEAPTVPFKINGASKTNGAHPAPAKPISVRVSGDGLLVEVQVKHETAMEVLEAL
jgi:hypothetical protein